MSKLDKNIVNTFITLLKSPALQAFTFVGTYRPLYRRPLFNAALRNKTQAY